MARPLAFGEPATQAISVRVTEAQQRELQRVARDNQVRVSDVIRDAVDAYVADYREAQVFRRTKL